MAAFQESVASDIGEEQGRDASILEPAPHIGNGHVGSLRPAFRRDEAVARIDSHHDPARDLTCGVLPETRVPARRRADHQTTPDARRIRKEWVRTCRYRWPSFH